MEAKENLKKLPQLVMGASARKTLQLVIGAAAIYAMLLWITMRWPNLLTTPEITPYLPITPDASTHPPIYPILELMKLMIAALLGTLVTQVHKYYHRDKLLSRSLEHAQVLLCISGAMMMIIIGESLARAFGIAGAAAIIRFRTPVEDPKDTTILFLVLGVGMACGLGAFGVAGLTSFFLCGILFLLHHIGEQKPRAMMLELTAQGSEFPTAHVQNIFAAFGINFEPREVMQGEAEPTYKYYVVLAPNTSLEYLSDQLMGGGFSGIKSVVWQAPKKGG